MRLPDTHSRTPAVPFCTGRTLALLSCLFLPITLSHRGKIKADSGHLATTYRVLPYATRSSTRFSARWHASIFSVISTPGINEIFDITARRQCPTKSVRSRIMWLPLAARFLVMDNKLRKLSEYDVRRMASRYHVNGKFGDAQPTSEQRCRHHEHEEGQQQCDRK